MKYIDAEKLIAEIDSILSACTKQTHTGVYNTCHRIKGIIASLQQEQPKSKLVKVRCILPFDETWEKNKIYTCKVWHHGQLNRYFWDVYYDYENNPKYVQFSTIELLNEEFAIIKDESQVIQEQPEVDLEKEIDRLWPDLSDEISGPHNKFDIYARIAHHFYELRNRALEEAAQHVYESWMGGIMDVVRRDMVELGKVLNARKEE